MTPQLLSLRTSFRGLFITPTEAKKSVVYAGKGRHFVEKKDPIWLEIELTTLRFRFD
jgi:hypothetical protein